MRTVNFKNSVIALAIGLSVISCGGRGGNQQSGTVTTETESVSNNSGYNDAQGLNSTDPNWPSNEFTKVLPGKPYGKITKASVQDMGSYKVFSVEVDGTHAQAAEYGATLYSNGFAEMETENNEVFKGSKDGYTTRVVKNTGGDYFVEVVKR